MKDEVLIYSKQKDKYWAIWGLGYVNNKHSAGKFDRKQAENYVKAFKDENLQIVEIKNE